MMNLENFGLSRGQADLGARVGPTYLVGYLGSAVLNKNKNGLDCLQQPLHELYSIFRQNLSRLNQERRIIVSHDGITIIFNDLGIEKFLFNEIGSVFDVQLLKVVFEKRKDQQIYAAFLPLGEQHDLQRFMNIFYPLTKLDLYSFEGRPHAPLIALIMRHSTVIQALECHVFIARSSSDANSIVSSIRESSRRHKIDQESFLNYNNCNLSTEIPIYVEKEIRPFQSRLSSKSSQSLLGKLKANFKEKTFKSNEDNHRGQHLSKKKEINHRLNLNQTSTSTISGSCPSAFSAVKKPKKLNFGKRLIDSTKSKIKSSSSSNLTLSNDSDLKSLADIDFQRSKTSIIDENLLIDDFRILSNNKMNIGDVYIPNENFVLKSRPSSVVSLDRSSNPRFTRNQIKQINDEFNQFYDSQRRVELPSNNPQTLSNHLAWNKNSRSVENLDRIETKEGFGIARAISPGNTLKQAALCQNLQSPSVNYTNSCYSNSSRTSTPVTANFSRQNFNKDKYHFVAKKLKMDLEKKMDLTENFINSNCNIDYNSANCFSSDNKKFKNVNQTLGSSICNKPDEFKNEENLKNIKKFPRLSLFESDLLKQTKNSNFLENDLSYQNQQQNFLNESKIIDLTKKVNGLKITNLMKNQFTPEINEIKIKEIPIEHNSAKKSYQEKSTNLSNFEPSQGTLFSTEYTELDNQNFFNDKNRYLIKENFYY